MTDAAPLFDDVADAPPGGRAFWCAAADGLRLRAAVWRGGGRGLVVVFPGRTEFIEKYGRVVGHLLDRGFSAAVIDWRGQGLSQRDEFQPHLGHVADFRHYQQDVEALLAHPELAACAGPRHLLAHSMGGCIALRTLLERDGFASAVLAAPMWGLQVGTAAREAASRLSRIAARLRLTPPPRPETEAAFERNALTSDPDQFAWCAAQVTGHPELGLGGPNMQWTRAAFTEMARLRPRPSPALPLLVLLGGEEIVVSCAAIRSRMARSPGGRLLELPGARHELFMERPAVQARVWAEIDAFHAAHAPPG